MNTIPTNIRYVTLSTFDASGSPNRRDKGERQNLRLSAFDADNNADDVLNTSMVFPIRKIPHNTHKYITANQTFPMSTDRRGEGEGRPANNPSLVYELFLD